MNTNSIPISVFATCDRSREIWSQLNELRGLLSSTSCMNCDLKRLTERLEKLRDDVAMNYAHEWGGTGGLRRATLESTIPQEKLSLFLEEQTQIYGMITDLAEEAEGLGRAGYGSPLERRKMADRFKLFDVLLISHESRKSMALHGR